MVRILLSCAGGLSTGILVDRMQKEARSRDIECEIRSIGTSTIKNELGKFDVLLYGPHMTKKEIESIVSNKAAYAPIDLRDYSELDGKHILDAALNVYQNNN